MILILSASVFFACLISATVGQGGSLLMVPAMIGLFGPKNGVAIAALFLALNNVFKMVAYFKHIPRQAMSLSVVTFIGAFVGASLMAQAPDRLVLAAVVLMMIAAFFIELLPRPERQVQGSLPHWLSYCYAGTAGVTSGFSGTSGPLKGLSVKMMQLPPIQVVGGLTLLSFIGDVTKVGVFLSSGLISPHFVATWWWIVLLMPLATGLGRYLNTKKITPRAFNILFWSVMALYAARLIYFSW